MAIKNQKIIGMKIDKFNTSIKMTLILMEQ